MKEYTVPEGGKPCPFCGAKGQKVQVTDSFAKISCECGLYLIIRRGDPPDFVHVEGDMYRLVGESTTEFLKRIGKTWNKRWHA